MRMCLRLFLIGNCWRWCTFRPTIVVLFVSLHCWAKIADDNEITTLFGARQTYIQTADWVNSISGGDDYGEINGISNDWISVHTYWRYFSNFLLFFFCLSGLLFRSYSKLGQVPDSFLLENIRRLLEGAWCGGSVGADVWRAKIWLGWPLCNKNVLSSNESIIDESVRRYQKFHRLGIALLRVTIRDHAPGKQHNYFILGHGDVKGDSNNWTFNWNYLKLLKRNVWIFSWN